MPRRVSLGHFSQTPQNNDNEGDRMVDSSASSAISAAASGLAQLAGGDQERTRRDPERHPRSFQHSPATKEFRVMPFIL